MRGLLTQEDTSFVELEDFHSVAKNAGMLDLLLEANLQNDLDSMETILYDLEYLSPSEDLEAVRTQSDGFMYRMWVKVR